MPEPVAELREETCRPEPPSPTPSTVLTETPPILSEPTPPLSSDLPGDVSQSFGDGEPDDRPWFSRLRSPFARFRTRENRVSSLFGSLDRDAPGGTILDTVSEYSVPPEVSAEPEYPTTLERLARMLNATDMTSTKGESEAASRRRAGDPSRPPSH